MRGSESLAKMEAFENAHRFCLASTPCSMWPSATITSARSRPRDGHFTVATVVVVE
jgi:hypothetical protein